MWNPFDFSNKKIIVTGATSGIGRETALMLARQGAQVILLARNFSKMQETVGQMQGFGHRCYKKDFLEPGGYNEIYDDIVSDGRKIDGLVHCAGISKVLPVGFLNHMTIEESMMVNFYSFVEMVSLLSKNKYHNQASVVGLSSIATVYPSKCQSTYVATKSALNAICSSMAIELANKGIRINTVMPGSTKTRMLQEAYNLLIKQITYKY